MLNGAVTLGTMDGANVEIAQMVGEENIYTLAKALIRLFSITATAITLEGNGLSGTGGSAAALDFLIGPEMLEGRDAESLHRLYDELVNKDWFMTLPTSKITAESRGMRFTTRSFKGCVGGKNAR